MGIWRRLVKKFCFHPVRIFQTSVFYKNVQFDLFSCPFCLVQEIKVRDITDKQAMKKIYDAEQKRLNLEHRHDKENS